MRLVLCCVIPRFLHHVATAAGATCSASRRSRFALGVALDGSALGSTSPSCSEPFSSLARSGASRRPASVPRRRRCLAALDAFAGLVSSSLSARRSICSSSSPMPPLRLLLIITLGKSTVAYAVMRLFRYPESRALMIAASRVRSATSRSTSKASASRSAYCPRLVESHPCGRTHPDPAQPLPVRGADCIYAHHEPPKKAPESRHRARAATGVCGRDADARGGTGEESLTNDVALVGRTGRAWERGGSGAQGRLVWSLFVTEQRRGHRRLYVRKEGERTSIRRQTPA